jgi:uncharacterized protein YbgA (DUF1722 family)
MQSWSRRRVAALAGEELSGYVLKKDSPSCGLERVRLYGAGGTPARTGRGLFAAALVARHPALPVEEEGRLGDAGLRENFVSRVFAFHRWQEMARGGPTRARLFRFHELHKYQLMAHSQTGLRQLGHLLGSAARGVPARKLADDYLREFSAVMARVPTRRSHTNVLQHLAGYVSEGIDAGDRAELSQSIARYRAGHLPLVVPVTLLRHHVRRLQVPYLLDQVYLSPHPDELMLLNEI